MKTINETAKARGDWTSPKRRLLVTGLAIAAVSLTAVVKAKLLGEFVWHVGW